MDMTLDFALGENADMIRDVTQRFATDKIAPLAAKIDAEDWFPRDLWPAMGELGLHGITVEEEFGGLGLGYLEHVIACEEVSRASASIGLSYGAHSNLCVNQIRRWGNPEQKAKYLPKLVSGEHVGSLAMSESGAGSDVVSMKLRADEVAGRLCAQRHQVLDHQRGLCRHARRLRQDRRGLARYHHLPDREGHARFLDRSEDRQDGHARHRPRPSSCSTTAKCPKRISWARSTAASAC